MRAAHFTDRAEKDFEMIRNWYLKIDPALAALFVEEVFEIVQIARSNLNRFPKVDRTTHATMLRTFSYKIFFGLDKDVLLVLAVYHTSRQPRRWSDPHRD